MTRSASKKQSSTGIEAVMEAAKNRSPKKVSIATPTINQKREASPGITQDVKMCKDNSLSDEIPVCQMVLSMKFYGAGVRCGALPCAPVVCSALLCCALLCFVFVLLA